ncbi:MAG: formate dehydrogenase accessory sulfurtransferase FdhD [Acidimicrobiales bacterium]
MGRGAKGALVVRVAAGSEPLSQPDWLAIEAPLELRVGGRSLAVTMRTPGSDFELAAGFLVSEGVVAAREDLSAMRYCAGSDRSEVNRYNVLDAVLAPGVAPPPRDMVRAFFTSSSCGLCGKAGIDTVRTRSTYEIRSDSLRVDAGRLTALPERLQAAQRVFDQTGGVHAAAPFDGTSGDLLVLREDVGRHNAVDKVVGWALLDGRVPLRGTVLLVSGRASFELVQKALMAGIPMLCAVSAPSSLAVELAAESGMTLVGFLRIPSMVIYCGAERVGMPPHRCESVPETTPVSALSGDRRARQLGEDR